MNIKTMLFNLPTIAANFFFPQFNANDINQYHSTEKKRWSWIVRPLDAPAAEWILEDKALIFARWVILAGPVSMLSVKLGPPTGALIYFAFYAGAAWTLIGVARTYAVQKARIKKNQEKDNS